MCDLPVVAGGAGRGVAWLSAILREGRGETGSMHGVERPVSDSRNHLSTLVKVGEAVIDVRM